MSGTTLEAWYRSFLLVVAAAVLVGVTLELWLSEHTEGFVQLIPFGLTAAGLAATLAVIAKPTRATLLVLRAAAAVLAGGAAYGIYEHFDHNLGFELEIRPASGVGDVFWDALFGASPLLAPAALALAAVLAAAATYRHPVLQRQETV